MGHCAKSHVCLERKCRLHGGASHGTKTSAWLQLYYCKDNNTRSHKFMFREAFIIFHKICFIIKICFTFLRILKSPKRQHPATIHKDLQIFLKSINRIFFYRRKFLLTLIIFRIECILRQLIGYSIIWRFQLTWIILNILTDAMLF